MWLRAQLKKSNIKQCIKYRQKNLHPQHYATQHLEVPSIPMHFIAMVVIGKFKPSPQGYQYVLTVMNKLTNYTWCMPLHIKEAGSHKILSNNVVGFGNT